MHGYNNSAPEMRASFIARGPAFSVNKRIPAFHNVQVFGVLCKVLGLDCSGERWDGSLGWLDRSGLLNE